jgi:hypothetical protein
MRFVFVFVLQSQAIVIVDDQNTWTNMNAKRLPAAIFTETKTACTVNNTYAHTFILTHIHSHIHT